MKTYRPPRVFPLAPLGEYFSSGLEATKALRVSGTTWKKWREEGLNQDEADRAAGAVKCHPSELWSDWYALADTWIPAPRVKKNRGTRPKTKKVAA